jgi:intracellular sulfur oxidation DsrE/DsrF family protein
MNNQSISEEQLNAFVDDQLGQSDRERVFEAINRDPELARRVNELRQLKERVRHAYHNPPQPHRQKPPMPRGIPYALAASLLLLMGVASGWLLHDSPLLTKTLATATNPKGVVIQVSDNDPAKWNMALINAQNVSKALGSKVAIEIVAYGPGLQMFKSDSPVAQQLKEIAEKGIKLLACGNTMAATHTRRDQLSQSVGVVPAGILEIMEKQHMGYAYVRP